MELLMRNSLNENLSSERELFQEIQNNICFSQ